MHTHTARKRQTDRLTDRLTTHRERERERERKKERERIEEWKTNGQRTIPDMSQTQTYTHAHTHTHHTGDHDAKESWKPLRRVVSRNLRLSFRPHAHFQVQRYGGTLLREDQQEGGEGMSEGKPLHSQSSVQIRWRSRLHSETAAISRSFNR